MHEYVFLLTKSASYFYDAEAVKEPGSPLSHGGNFRGPGEKWKLVGNHSGQSLGQPPESGTRNRRSVWHIATQPYKGAHFATFPEKLVEPCILAGSRPGDVVLDPFCGSGTVGVVCARFNRDFVGMDISEAYLELARDRIAEIPNALPFHAEVTA